MSKMIEQKHLHLSYEKYYANQLNQKFEKRFV